MAGPAGTAWRQKHIGFVLTPRLFSGSGSGKVAAQRGRESRSHRMPGDWPPWCWRAVEGGAGA